MKPEEVRQLLGGYASGTLSDAERKLLFEAAMEDQVLFDAMADEQALKDLLDDPESRGYLQAVLDESPVASGLDLPLAAAPAPQMMRKREAPSVVVSKRPAVWWGLLAAAALATVSVLGILKLSDKPLAPPVEVAKNTAMPAPAATPPPVVPAPTPVKVKADSKPAYKVGTQPEAAREPAEARRSEEKAKSDDLARKAKDEVAPALSSAPPSPPALSEAAPQRAVTPAPSQDQLQQMRTQMTPSQPGARELYLADKEMKGATGSQSASPSVELSPGAVDSRAKKVAGGAAIAAGKLSGNAMPAAAPMKPGFAMRYKIIRKRGVEEVTVTAGSKFKIGDELILIVEKNSGGTVVIERMSNGSAPTEVPLANQTNEVARSVPLTVTGPMEFAIILNRSASPVQGIPPRPALQKTEVADGMVYVGEPAAAAGQPLVIRVSIPVE